jgi:hypothetical protein
MSSPARPRVAARSLAFRYLQDRERVVMVDDAAMSAGPHIGFGMAKAGCDTLASAEHVRDHEDIGTTFKPDNAERQSIVTRVVVHARKLGTELGVDPKTEDDRCRQELVQSDDALRDWIAVPNDCISRAVRNQSCRWPDPCGQRN